MATTAEKYVSCLLPVKFQMWRMLVSWSSNQNSAWWNHRMSQHQMKQPNLCEQTKNGVVKKHFLVCVLMNHIRILSKYLTFFSQYCRNNGKRKRILSTILEQSSFFWFSFVISSVVVAFYKHHNFLQRFYYISVYNKY